jgi:hypothetical protein
MTSVSLADREVDMSKRNYSIIITVDKSPAEVFAAINNVRGWWSNNIDGDTARRGAEFTFRHEDMHRSTHKIMEFTENKKVVWQTTRSKINFVKNKNGWDGTAIIFEISQKGKKSQLLFTHVGLVPSIESYDGCSGAWDFYVGHSLRSLITTGQGKAEPRDKTSAD